MRNLHDIPPPSPAQSDIWASIRHALEEFRFSPLQTEPRERADILDAIQPYQRRWIEGTWLLPPPRNSMVREMYRRANLLRTNNRDVSGIAMVITREERARLWEELAGREFDPIYGDPLMRPDGEGREVFMGIPFVLR